MNKLYGYEYLAQSMHKGQPGLGRGAMARKPGRMHLWDGDYDGGRSACGLPRRAMVVQLVPNGVDENNHHVKLALCQRCLAHAKEGAR